MKIVKTYITLSLFVFGAASLQGQDFAAKIGTPVYPVYRLSPKTTAFLIELFIDNQNAVFDSIVLKTFENDSLSFYSGNHRFPVLKKNSTWYDTLGPFSLMYNKNLEKEVKKYFDKVYVYGIRGYAKINIDNVAYVEECLSNFIAVSLDNFDTTRLGQPVFCTRSLLKLNYERNIQAEKEINTFLENESTDEENIQAYPYGWVLGSTVFANYNDFYFTFKDDFKWYKRQNSDTNFLFPHRAAYTVRDGEVETQWFELLDLERYSCE